MITETPTIPLSKPERLQLERIDEAKSLWREGRSEDALILIESVKSEPMTPQVAVECYLNEAVFYAERGDFNSSLQSLAEASSFIDHASLNAQGTFYNQRARARKELELFDDALTDYAGAAILWERIGNTEKQGAAALNVAGCYLALKNLEDAQANIEKAFPLLAGSFFLPQAHDTQAQIHLANGNLEQAARSIATALSMDAPDNWRTKFLATQDQIESRLLDALQVKDFAGWEAVKLRMVRRALQQSNGNLGGAARILGVTRYAVECWINYHLEELEPYRAPKRVRHKSIIKKM